MTACSIDYTLQSGRMDGQSIRAMPAQETVTAYIYSYIQRFRGGVMDYQGNIDHGCEQLSIDSDVKDIDAKAEDIERTKAKNLPKFLTLLRSLVDDHL